MRFNESTYIVDEEEGTVEVVLVLSHPASTNIIVTILSISGSAKGKAFSYVYMIAMHVRTYVCTYVYTMCVHL